MSKIVNCQQNQNLLENRSTVIGVNYYLLVLHLLTNSNNQVFTLIATKFFSLREYISPNMTFYWCCMLYSFVARFARATISAGTLNSARHLSILSLHCKSAMSVSVLIVCFDVRGESPGCRLISTALR